MNIPPSQSVYVTMEWSLVRQIETKTKTVTIGSVSGSESGSSSDSTATTTTLVETAGSNDETDWDRSSIRIVDCFFN